MSLLDVLFGCHHKNLSFPISPKAGHRRTPAQCYTGTYVVCLECGEEFPYDWQNMRIVSASTAGKGSAAVQDKSLLAIQ